MSLDATSRARIAPYVSNLTDDVFALAGLPEEVIAVLFAYYSRSRDDLRTNLAKLLADQELDVAAAVPQRSRLALATDKARAFHEKWVVGYGHASVAEHAVIHLALENVSIIASKVVEDLRLGSYTEKSTRYVVFDKNSFVEPPELSGEALKAYRSIGEQLFSTYLDLVPKVMDTIRARVAKPEGFPEAAHTAAIRAQACDLLRGLLPAGTRTNIGLTANARAMEMLLSKMFSHPLEEVQILAEAMHKASLHVTPTLVKYASENPYRQGLNAAVEHELRRVYSPPPDGASATMVVTQPVRLLRWDKDALERIALALCYDNSDSRTHAHGLQDGLRHATPAELAAIVKSGLDNRGPHDPPPRAFETTSFTFELMLDYGAYRDLQRHRMLSPATQRLTCRLGFDTPHELAELGHADTYLDTMLGAHAVWETIEAEHPLAAQYAVPLGYRIRTLWTLNLRELFHVVELRSSKQGHSSYRRVAQALYRAACGVHPWLKDAIHVDLNDYALARG